MLIVPVADGPASESKLNLRSDLRWVAKRTRNFPHKYTQIAKQHFKADCPLFHWLIIGWTWVGWSYGVKLALTVALIFDLDQSERKSERKCTQALAKQSGKQTEVFNLRLLATPFGQGLSYN